MNDIYYSSNVLLAHVLFEMNSSFYVSLAVMALFVFGLLLFRKFGRIPKGLFISSFISYVLLLINILYFVSDLRIPKAVGYLCLYPSFLIAEVLMEWLSETWLSSMFDGRVILFWVAFSINTLGIFAIIRLILYIKRKVSAKKSQVKQAV